LTGERGYLPTDILLAGTKPLVRFAQYPESVFAEPFLDVACQRHRSMHGEPHSMLLDPSAPAGSVHPPAAHADTVAGFVFHMSRCGSTLITQMLSQLAHYHVLSEPGAVGALLRMHIDPTRKSELLQFVLSSYRNSFVQRPAGLVCKLSSQSTLHIDAVLTAYPRTPWIFVIREPREVIESLISYAQSSEARMESVRSRCSAVLELSTSQASAMTMKRN